MPSPGEKLLKISELARRSGVGRGTIQHYLREGLLPTPKKTSRNMAYYDASCVERIKTIKQLQSRGRLSLSTIRELLAETPSGSALASSLIEAQRSAVQTLAPRAGAAALSPSSAAKAFDIRREVIDALERLDIANTREVDGNPVFIGADLEVLAAIANLDRLGLSERIGFTPDDLTMYRDAIRALIENEIRMFVEVAGGSAKADDLPKLATAALDAVSMLLVAMRRKLLGDLLGNSETSFIDVALGAGEPEPAGE